MEHDYTKDVEALIETLNSQNFAGCTDWHWGILGGAPEPLTAEDVIGIAEWMETEAPAEWDKDCEEHYDEVARRLREIVAA